MNCEICEMKELTFQELWNYYVTTEEQFQDKIHDILSEEINNQISKMQLVEIDEIVHNYGISKAISLHINNFGELYSSPEEHWGKDAYTPGLVYQIIFEGVMDSELWDEYQEYLKEKICYCTQCQQEPRCDCCGANACEDCNNECDCTKCMRERPCGCGCDVIGGSCFPYSHQINCIEMGRECNHTEEDLRED